MNTASGFSAVVVIAGVVVGIAGIVMFATGRPSESASKWIGAGIGLMAIGLIIAAI